MNKKIVFGAIGLGLCVAIGAGYVWYRHRATATKQFRILACISSWNRPVFVSGQVLRMLNQTYPVDISVSVKGVPQDFFEGTLYREWEPAIRSGRIKVRLDANRDQYANFLDTVRNVDLNQYDYFCKVDDDDWYGPDYFKHVNEALNRPHATTLSYTKSNWIISPGKKGVVISANNTPYFGPSMCFSRRLIALALEIEKNHEKAADYLPDMRLYDYKQMREDNFLHQLSKATGAIEERHTPIDDLAFGWQYPSVMRQ